MSKVVLADTISGYNLQVINNNFDLIEAALNDKVLYRDNPDGEANSMADPLDMNGQRIINLPAPGGLNDAARMQDVVDATAGITNAAAMPFSPTATIAATNVQGAIAEADTENRALSAAIVTDLATSNNTAKGDALVAVKRSETGAIATTQHLVNQARTLNAVADFGWVGDDATDNSAAVTAAVAGALAAGKALVIPPGTYRSSTVFDFSGQGLRIYGIGHVVLKASTGSTNSRVVQVDSASSAAYVNELHNFTIEGNGTANQDGLYQRNYTHVKRSGLRVRNVSRYAYHILGDVLSKWDDCASTINEGSMTTTPTHCFFLGGTAQITDTTAVQFNNCFGEGMTAYGLYADRMVGCSWNGGSFEGMPTGTGVYLSSNTRRNTLQDMFCEANLVGGDLIDYGKGNKLFGGTYSSRKATPAYEDVKCITIKAGAEQTQIIGVKGYAVTVEATALSTTFDLCDFDYIIADSGTNTRILRTRQLFNTSSIIADVKELTGSTTYNPALLNDGEGVTTTVTVTGAVTGDYVSHISFSNDLQGILLTGYVSSANTVSVRFQNESGGALDLASGTIRVVVRKQ